ncbi:hypothetical protein VH564_00120 [Rhizobium sp. HT1-10]
MAMVTAFSSKFDVRSIMSEAWAIYRRDTRMSRPSLTADRRKLFARCLRTAWAWAKQRIADAMKSLQQRAADRIHELTLELTRIESRGWKMPTLADRRTVLEEIASLEGRA